MIFLVCVLAVLRVVSAINDVLKVILQIINKWKIDKDNSDMHSGTLCTCVHWRWKIGLSHSNALAHQSI